MNEWIDINIKKPDKNGRYIVVENNSYQWVGVCSMRNGGFDMPITHWMELPKPPNKDK
jgi:hypothetical protein